MRKATTKKNRLWRKVSSYSKRWTLKPPVNWWRFDIFYLTNFSKFEFHLLVKTDNCLPIHLLLRAFYKKTPGRLFLPLSSGTHLQYFQKKFQIRWPTITIWSSNKNSVPCQTIWALWVDISTTEKLETKNFNENLTNEICCIPKATFNPCRQEMHIFSSDSERSLIFDTLSTPLNLAEPVVDTLLKQCFLFL